MAVKTNYDFKGILVEDAIIGVARIFGSSKEGWYSLVTVSIQNKENPENFVLEEIERFNFQAPFDKNERGYVTVYKALMEKYGGVEI